MATRNVVEAIQDIIEALHYHEMITPEGGGEPTPGPEIKYFKHVWIGKPQKIPTSSPNIVFIEAESEPIFNRTTCKSKTTKELDVLITVGCMGSVETATVDMYDKTELVISALDLDTTKLNSTCMASEIQEVMYGEMDTGMNDKRIVAGSRITLKIYMEA